MNTGYPQSDGNKFARFTEYDALQCPECSEGNLHQSSVIVLVRPNGEDREALAVYVDGECGSTHSAPHEGDARRQSIRIHFDCEMCGHVGQLRIIQHKGSTYMEWDTSTIDYARRERQRLESEALMGDEP